MAASENVTYICSMAVSLLQANGVNDNLTEEVIIETIEKCVCLLNNGCTDEEKEE